jgi:hypothetical protein
MTVSQVADVYGMPVETIERILQKACGLTDSQIFAAGQVGLSFSFTEHPAPALGSIVAEFAESLKPLCRMGFVAVRVVKLTTFASIRGPD